MIFRLSGGNRNVFGIMLISAACVTLIRLFGPIRIQWDLSIQLEAAYRLVQGLSLTNAFSSQLDLNQPPISEHLTHFPPGLSLLVAAFIYFGIPLVVALKIIYCLTTIIGWFGWSIIGSRCLVQPIKIFSRSFQANLMIASILPIFYTPSWTNQGTDIFLWAGTPIVVLLLLHSFGNRFWFISTILSGLTFLLLLSFRYASGFLLLAALPIIFYIDFPNIKALFIRYCTFASSWLLLIIPMSLYIMRVSETGFNHISSNDLLQTHGARYLNSNLLDSIFQSIEKNIYSLSNLYILTGINTNKLESWVDSNSMISTFIGLVFLFFLSTFSLILVRYKRSHGNFLGGKVSILLLCVMISLILFSAILTFFISYSPLEVERYYLPVQPCTIFLGYRIATLADFNRLFKQLSTLFIFVFVLYNLVLRPIYYFIIDETQDIMSLVLAAGTEKITDIRYPSNEITTFDQDSLNFLITTEKQEQNALFFIQQYSLYMSYANFRDPLKFRRISDSSFWHDAYLSKATKIVWVVNHNLCPSICASPGNFNSDSPEIPIQSLSSLPNLKTVFQSSENEEVVVMVSDLPTGYRFSKNSSP